MERRQGIRSCDDGGVDDVLTGALIGHKKTTARRLRVVEMSVKWQGGDAMSPGCLKCIGLTIWQRNLTWSEQAPARCGRERGGSLCVVVIVVTWPALSGEEPNPHTTFGATNHTNAFFHSYCTFHISR